MFAQMMIVHQQGALEMAQMASSQAVKGLAAKITAVQEPEMEQMTSCWSPEASRLKSTPVWAP